MAQAHRPKPTFREELALRETGHPLIAGIDEVGRGPLAGPVVAAAVILPEDWITRRLRRPRGRNGKRPRLRDPRLALDDSKVLTRAQRERLYRYIVAGALAWGIGSASAHEIESRGLVRATKAAMGQAVDNLRLRPDALLVDAVDLSELGYPCKAIIDGDALCGSIAAASIVAKVTRDRLMEKLDGVYPGYGFARHKGYGTSEHLRRLDRLGPCALHRRSFAPVRDLLIKPRLL